MKLLCLFLALCQVPDELPVPFPADATVPKIIAPMTPVLAEPEMIEVPQPPKKEYPTAKIIDTVKFGELYVLESNVELFIYQCPAELFKITERSGPRTLVGRFVDGNGDDYEDREFLSKHIYMFKAHTSGKVQIIAVPSGVTDQTLIFNQVLTVGAGPNPPPIPEPEPTPTPVPVPKTGFRVLLVISENASLNHLAIADSLSIRDWLNANCEGGKAGWQRWSKKSLLDPTFLSNEEAYWKELVTTLKPETLPDTPTIYAMQGAKVHMHAMSDLSSALKFLQGLK
jgi:hypothetical protein